MSVYLNKLVTINASGLVLIACNSHEIKDSEQIEKHKQWVVNQVLEQMERDQVGVEALSSILDDKIALLNLRLEQGDGQHPVHVPQKEKDTPSPKEPEIDSSYKPKTSDAPAEPANEQQAVKEQEKPSPKPAKIEPAKKRISKDMPSKLAEERKPVKKLILEDCVQLSLISRKRAQYVVTQMAGKQPAEAEKEIVLELRKNLHEQVRSLIRKDKDGPWTSPKSQEELRLEIVQTPTVRSILYLTREILKERDEWKRRNRKSITGRIFGGRLVVDKNK